jgi:Fe-S cluster biogenesis protein NfuA
MSEEAVQQTQEEREEDFQAASMVQKFKMIESIISQDIRGFLNNDGGDIEIIDIKQNE